LASTTTSQFQPRSRQVRTGGARDEVDDRARRSVKGSSLLGRILAWIAFNPGPPDPWAPKKQRHSASSWGGSLYDSINGLDPALFPHQDEKQVVTTQTDPATEIPAQNLSSDSAAGHGIGQAHPLKMETRVEIPLGLPAKPQVRSPRSISASVGCPWCQPAPMRINPIGSDTRLRPTAAAPRQAFDRCPPPARPRR